MIILFKKLLVATALFGMLLSCGKKNENVESVSDLEDKSIKLAVASYPMENIGNIVAEELKEQGYDVEITVLTDYVTANVGLAAGDFDANFHQHEPFMNVFNQNNNANLVKVVPVYDVKVGFYSRNIQSKDDIQDGATVVIPNDPTNKDRALRILEKEGLISFNEEKDGLYTVDDVDNTIKSLNIIELPIPSLVQAYQENDLVFNWPAHMIKIGKTPDDALFLEENSGGRYAVILAAREDNKDSKKIQDLANAFTSDKVKQFLEENYSVEGYPVF